MTAEHYHALYRWFDAHPAARRFVVALDRWLPLVPFVCYPVLLCLLNVRLVQLFLTRQSAAPDLMSEIARSILVPGITFWVGTALRARLDRPRPYDQPGFTPLVQKDTHGRSFPSRHALSAAVLAMVWLYFYPAVGWCMIVIALLIAVVRVLTGVHHIRDVAAGLANKAKDWELAVDENGNALIDLLEVPVRMTFDSSSLTGEPKADTDGRALPSSNLYTLRVTGICSTLNNNFATAAFMSFDRLQEMTQANANYMGATTQTKTAEEKANGPTYDLVWVKVKNVNDVQRIVKLIRDTGLNTYSLNDMLETVRTQSRQIQGMLGALGGIAVLISAICVANTMMMSITERTREIGVLKVLGTVRSDIFKMFLSEALIVGVIGGAAGLVLSFIAKWLIPVIFASRELRCVLPWWLAVCGVVFSGCVAIAAAWIPARKATLISPNEAIRSE